VLDLQDSGPDDQASQEVRRRKQQFAVPQFIDIGIWVVQSVVDAGVDPKVGIYRAVADDEINWRKKAHESFNAGRLISRVGNDLLRDAQQSGRWSSVNSTASEVEGGIVMLGLIEIHTL